MLEEGYCIMRVNSIKEPFLLDIPYIKRSTITVSDITSRNQQILKNSQTSLHLKPGVSPISNKTPIKNVKNSLPSKPSRIKRNHNLESVNEKKEETHLISKKNQLNKEDYVRFNTFINKLYSDQKKNK